MILLYYRVYGKSALAPMNKFACKLHGYSVYFYINLNGTCYEPAVSMKNVQTARGR